MTDAERALQVTLYIGNLTEEWGDEERLRRELGAHGRLERAFIARNPQGLSKVRPPSLP